MEANLMWGLSLTELTLLTFNSTVKKVPFLLYANRSGVPKPLKFSNLVNDISGINFLTFSQNFLSGFKVIRPFQLLYPLSIFPYQL
jgi:hypothetical protein